MKKLVAHSLGLILVFASLATVLFTTSVKPHKAYAQGEGQLCVPASSTYKKGGIEPKGWLELHWVNRSAIKLVHKSSDCTFIAANKEFAPLIEGIYYDENIDSDFDYRSHATKNKDDSRIDRFDGALDGGLNDSFGGKNKVVSASYLDSRTQNVELTISLEEDSIGLPGINCSDTNGNFLLSIKSGKASWSCIDSTGVGDAQGYKVFNDFLDKENFNITYYVSGSGIDTKVIPVDQNNRSNRTFSWCPNSNGTGGNFKTDSCSGNLSINASLDTLATLGTKSASFTITDGSKVESFIIAGSQSDSSQVDAQVANSTLTSALGDAFEIDCKTKLTNPLTWIGCPIIKLANDVVNSFTHIIDDYLFFNTGGYLNENAGTGSSGVGYYSVWNSVRLISTILIIVVFLAMVFSRRAR